MQSPPPLKGLQKPGNSDRKRSGSPEAATESEDEFLRVSRLVKGGIFVSSVEASLISQKLKIMFCL